MKEVTEEEILEFLTQNEDRIKQPYMLGDNAWKEFHRVMREYNHDQVDPDLQPANNIPRKESKYHG